VGMLVHPALVLLAEISSNFDLKNMISTNKKEFFMGKMTQIRQISKKIIRNRPDFDSKFQ
jgi:hypothetical protein